MSKTRLLLLASALTFCVTPLKAQQSDVQALTLRVEQLEHQVAELERRLRALEAPTQPAQTKADPASGDWKQIGNWRRLHQGMKMSEVKTVLGEPDRVDASPAIVFWHYGNSGANVTFDSESQKVTGWSEPMRERP